MLLLSQLAQANLAQTLWLRVHFAIHKNGDSTSVSLVSLWNLSKRITQCSSLKMNNNLGSCTFWRLCLWLVTCSFVSLPQILANVTLQICLWISCSPPPRKLLSMRDSFLMVSRSIYNCRGSVIAGRILLV